MAYVHEGGIDWVCSNGCEGAALFKNLVTRTEHPLVKDYESQLVEAEIEHALRGCNGRLSSRGGFHRTLTGY